MASPRAIASPALPSAPPPLAIVGIGCRFPGGIDSPASFWKLVMGGVDAVTEVPPERWNPDAFYGKEPRRGRTQTKWGGFVRQPIDEIDAGFFGISPREAAHLSPMQRWILECCWEALEDAGIAPGDLQGSDTGVFVGGFVEDALTLAHAESNRELLDMHTGTGVAISILSNRISYLLDLHGPSMTVDTACSSSLVAVHLAAQAIWSGQCPAAIVGGVNALLKPEFNIAASQAGMLSPTGRSRAFSARADGYTRGEGAGVVVLKPLDRAIADGNPIYACIRATGVNQDGHTNGITVPNAEAQATLMRTVYARAGVRPGELAYLEAHGTGTPVGDPLEMKALDAVLSEGRAAGDRCPVGSVKTNFGHTEGAAGVAGLIKAALVLKHGEVPPNLHFEDPNPAIPWDSLRTRVPTAPEKLVPRAATAFAGVNSFGFGGTNAHVLLESAPAPVQEAVPETEGPLLVPVSARSPEALRALAGRYAHWLENEGAEVPLAAVTSALATRKGQHSHRAALVAGSRTELREMLSSLAQGQPSPGMVEGRAPASAPALAFVYTGMGPQWWAMGRELHRHEPVFRSAIQACDAIFRRLSGWSLEEAMLAPEASSRMTRTEVAQPANFALQVGLTELLASWGVRPSVVVGHSVGEVAAAWASGALSLEQAVRVSYHRSRLQQKAAGRGIMLAASVGVEEAVRLTRGLEGRVSLAVVNSPQSVTLAGEESALRQVEAALQAKGTFCRMLKVEVAYHSYQMDFLREEVLEALAGLTPQPSTVPLYSTVTAGRLGGTELDGAYWWRNVRETVRMADTAATMIADGCHTFLQVGPHPVLATALRECLDARSKQGTVLSTLRRDAPERETMLASVGSLWTAGIPVDWRARLPQGPAIPLPTYPWQRQKLWVESEDSRQHRTGAVVHPLLGRRTGAPTPTWEHELGDGHAWLRDHKVQGAVVFPAAGYVELALAAARELHGGAAFTLENVTFRKALFLPDDDASMRMRVVLEPESGRFDVFSSTSGARPWAHHASGHVRPLPAESTAPTVSVAAHERATPEKLDVGALYAALGKTGLEYGPAFRVVSDARRGNGEVLARLRTSGGEGFVLHPALLDGGFQTLVGLAPAKDGVALPVAIERLVVYRPSSRALVAHGRIGEAGGDLALMDRDGHLVADLRGLKVQALSAGPDEEARLREGAYTWRWEEPIAAGSPSAARRSPTELVSTLQPTIDAVAATLGHAERVRSGNDLLDRLALAYTTEALEVLGFAFASGSHEEGSLADRFRIAPAQRRLFGSLLDLLVEEGALERNEGKLNSRRRPDVRPSAELFREAFLARPDYHAELELLRRCGANLPGVLWGRVEPLSLVFPKDALTSEHLYQDAPSLRLNNVMARESLAALVDALPPGRKLRVLEVGAGTGGTAAHVIPVLSADTASYVYSDVTSTFTARARERFRTAPYVEFRTLDIGTDPLAQGFEAASFDVVIAANVLHATPDLKRSLTHAASLLAPGGLLLMTEITNLPRMVKLTFGQLRDWWSFTDTELRRDGPTLSFEGWKGVLETVGFDEVTRFHDPAGEENSLVLARRARAAPEKAATPAIDGRWLVLADHEVGPALARTLPGAELVDVASRTPAQLGEFVASALASVTPPTGIIHLGALNAVPTELLDRASFEAAQRASTYAALHVFQAIAASSVRPRVVLVTRGAAAVRVGSESPAMAQTPLWGLGRVAINEHPDLPISIVDLDPAADPVPVLVRELATSDGEHEIAWRDGHRFVHRLAAAPWTVPAGPGDAFTLDDAGRARATTRSEPAANQVEIEVAASGLDGGEIAGRVTALGPGVTRFKVGDAVVGLAGERVSTHVTPDAAQLAPLPKHVSPEAAAALPRAFLQVYAGLEKLAQVSPGELVVVADAASATGLLALQEIERLGAEPVAVAGSAAARDLLRARGVRYVVDARLAQVADEVLRQTRGRAADVVLHPGSGEAAPEDLARALRPFGRFVFGGTATSGAERLGSLLLERSISFLPANPHALVAARPALAREAMQVLGARLADGSLTPIPYRACPPGDAAAARTPERRARMVGAQVLALSHPRARVLPAWNDGPQLRADASYLVTGGLSGLGLETARYLASRGAKHLVLVGRSGASTELARNTVAELERDGVRVLVARADVSDSQQVASLLAQVGRELPPLRGIVHGAMVLDDGFLTQLTPERFERVLAPKALGAWNLDVHTRDLPLDFFVLYSSIAAVGLRGQANYVAANMFLDALAHARVARGRPGLTINWGVIGEIGYVSRNAQLYGYFDQQGMRAVTPKEVTTALGHYLGRALPQAFVFPVDWAALGAFAPDMVRSPRFAHLAREAGEKAGRGNATSSDASRLQQIRATTDKAERHRLLSEYLGGVVATVLGLEASQLDRDRPVTELGLDSMMAIELSGRLQSALRVDVPVAKLLSGTSITQLSGQLA